MNKTRKRAESENDLFRDEAKHPNKRLHLSLPLPPSVNSMYINKRNGSKVLSNNAMKYVAVSRAIINEELEKQKWMKNNNSTWLYVDMVFFFPDRIRRDSHNMLKLLLDVMEGLVYYNDYYVLPRIHSVEFDKENPRVELSVSAQNQNSRDKGFKMAGVVV